MSGLGSTLNISKSAILSQQYGLAVTGNNIANVNNPDYSMQTADQTTMTSIRYAGYLFGTGVDTSQIQQNVDSFLENRLTDELSNQAAYEEAEAYMNILEGYFDADSDSSVGNLLTDFWNSWYDLSNNPLGSSERVTVYEQGTILANRLNSASTDIANMETDLNQEIGAAVSQINSYVSQIADLNVQITGLEGNMSANDLRDQRNAIIDDLGQLIDLDSFEKSNGSVIVTVGNGFPLVNGAEYNTLSQSDDKVLWQGSYGVAQDITANISGGKLAGWLEVRDEILPKVSEELDVLTKELIWAMNYQHSQGTGLEYFTGVVTGDYATDQSGLFSSYDFGDKIDYAEAFVMWMADYSSADTQYTKTEMDMNLSEASISGWSGSAPGLDAYSYKLTVVDSATLGDKSVIQTDGTTLGQVKPSNTDVAAALDLALAEQTLTINDTPSGVKVIEIKDTGGDAQRSAASIAESLSAIDGVDAYASELSAQFDLAGIADAEDGDVVEFSLYVDGLTSDQRFTVDEDLGGLAEQFEEALRGAAENINTINDDQDLYTNGLDITSSTGRTLGVQAFEVVDNAGVQIESFSNFDAGDSVTFTVESSGFGTSAATTTNISVSLPTGIDTSDDALMATAFYDALSAALADVPFTVEQDLSTNAIILRTTDGSNLTVRDGDSDTGLDARFDINELSGTSLSVGNNVFLFDGAGDVETYDADTLGTDTLEFSGNGTFATLDETSAGGVSAGVIVGTLTILTDPGVSIHSNVLGVGGLFDGNWAKSGSSIMTLGGENGFSNFDAGDTISFDLDGTTIDYTVGAASTTDLEFATELAAALNADLIAAGKDADYEILQTGSSVSILKGASFDDPIAITNFTDSGINKATLSVTTGTGSGTSNPENDLLESDNPYRNFATASLYADQGIIRWEKYDSNGLFTGEDGLITVEEDGNISIVESGAPTLSFDLSTGSLVAGNILTINTDETGSPDPLDFTVSGSADTQNETYQFTVTSGGTVEGLVSADDPIVIEWKTGTDSGTIEMEGSDPPLATGAAYEVEVDGMTLNFYGGALFENDVFTITTDASGVPLSTNEDGKATGELMSDWHWTIDSFADEFNRQAEGMTASTTEDNRLQFAASEDYYALANVTYSGSNGFNEENVSISVIDWSAIDFSVDDLEFARSSSGRWGMVNDPTGGVATFIPEGGDDDGFGIDFNADGLADIQIFFSQQVVEEGFVKMDFEKRDPDDIGFAFSDDSGASSGLVAAAGINNFFEGYDADTIEINEMMADTRFVAAARIDSETGEISQGDNTNALSMGDVQYQDITMKRWTYDRESGAYSSLSTTSLNGYFNTMTASVGIISSGIKTSLEFADSMVNNLTEQRNAVSAVSLDEEMIKLMEYQNAYSAASKLLTVVDEMMQTLINVI